MLSANASRRPSSFFLRYLPARLAGLDWAWFFLRYKLRILHQPIHQCFLVALCPRTAEAIGIQAADHPVLLIDRLLGVHGYELKNQGERFILRDHSSDEFAVALV